MSYVYKEYTIERKTSRVIIVTDVHNCHIEWHDKPTADRMELLCETMRREYERSSYDGILSLGDHSLDYWKWNVGGSYLWDEPVSNTDNFVKKYVHKMPTNFYMIPGNHEQYGNEKWMKITGYPREYAVVYGDIVFVMLDTFAGQLDPTENHDGVYTGINVPFVSAVLDAHPDKRIILCAHDLLIAKEHEEARVLVSSEPRILCAFTGNTHRDNTLILSDSWRRLPVFYCGDFSYNRGRAKEKNWGYRILDIEDGVISTEYVRAAE